MNWIEATTKPDAGLKGCVLVKCIAEIKDNDTGEVREYETDEMLEPEDKYLCVSHWESGNYSCDCNRRIFFLKANNEEVEKINCGEGGFSVNLKNKKDGIVYYREF